MYVFIEPDVNVNAFMPVPSLSQISEQAKKMAFEANKSTYFHDLI